MINLYLKFMSVIGANTLRVRVRITIILVAAVFFVVLLLTNSISSRRQLRALEIHGKVDKIETREKNTRYFLVNGEWIYFGTYSNTAEEQIITGDSLVKESGTYVLKINRKSPLGSYMKVYEVALE